jgi:O-antigen ligase
MVGPLFGAVALMGTVSVLGAVAFIGPVHRMILGGGETASSDMTRFDQAKLALPKIIGNPLTGHGIGNSAEVIGFFSPGGKLSVDTSILTLLVETGIPGFVLYFGMLFCGTYTMGRLYVGNNDRETSGGAALSCTFIAYIIYRLVLSQRENQWLFFILLAVSCVVLKLISDRAKKLAPQAIKSPTGFGVVSTQPKRPFDAPMPNAG